MPRRRMKVSQPISPIINPKIVAMTMSLERSENEGQIGNLRSCGENVMKIGSVNSEIICLKCLL